MNTDQRHKPAVTRSALLIALALITFTACGGGTPSGPDSSNSVVLNGSVVGLGSASSTSFDVTSQTSTTASITGTVTVSVQENPAISTTVASDGSFTLRGLPTGSFTLLFKRDGTPIGTLTFDSVMANQEVTITVSVTSGAVVLVQEQRTGVGHGDLEIEGRVEQVLLLNATGDSRFMINQKTVVVRPGQTSIREGNTQRPVADITVGRSVHVKGNFLPMEGTVQPVLASEIKLQDSGTQNPAATPTPTPRAACIIDGGVQGRSIELEGTIVSGNSAAFRLDARASSPVDVLAAGATLVCTPPSGPNAPTPAQCAASVTTGARVHVSGNLDLCTATSAQATASKVTVQK